MMVFAAATDGNHARATNSISATTEEGRIDSRRAILLRVVTRSVFALCIATPPSSARRTSRSLPCQGSGYPEGAPRPQFAVRSDQHRLEVVDQVDELVVPHLGAPTTSHRFRRGASRPALARLSRASRTGASQSIASTLADSALRRG